MQQISSKLPAYFQNNFSSEYFWTAASVFSKIVRRITDFGVVWALVAAAWFCLAIASSCHRSFGRYFVNFGFVIFQTMHIVKFWFRYKRYCQLS